MERICKTVGNVHQALQKITIHHPLLVVVVPGDALETRNKYHQKAELEQACLAEAG